MGYLIHPRRRVGVRPRVLLNCAVSQDRHLAGPDGQPVRLSDALDMQRVHAMRAGVDAILVGVGTVLKDDPSLLVKAEYVDRALADRHPMRVVLDTRLRTPATARVLQGDTPTIVYHAAGDKAAAAGLDGAELVRVPKVMERVDLEAVLQDLSGRGIESVMVEGGAEVLAAFLEAGCWDEWSVYEAPVHLGGGPAIPTPAQLREWGVAMTSEMARGDGWLRCFAPQLSR